MHAYLIIAHKNPSQLKLLLKQIDDERNAIFVLFDKKSNCKSLRSFNYDVQKSRLTFLKPRNISWGGYSQIKAELYLLKEATKCGHYDFLHLISGQDLLLKSQNDTHLFFNEHQGQEFVTFSKETKEARKQIRERTNYYYFLQNFIKRFSETKWNRFLTKIQNILLKWQKNIGVDRSKKRSTIIRKGDNWFSITYNLAVFLLQNKRQIRKTFRYTFCCDEFFIQTMIYDTIFYNKISPFSLRKIKWEHGTPYLWSDNDKDELDNSPCIFARKFDINHDAEIIKHIVSKTTTD